MSALELKIPPVALVLLAGAAMWLLSSLTPSVTLPVPYRHVAAIAFAGMIVALLGLIAFRRARTTVNPTTPHAASSLVGTGVYRFSRNPMYLGFLLALTGWTVFLANGLSAILVPGFVMYMNRFQIGPEERALSGIFGEQFTSYTHRVRRWV
ncbi:MAG: protein-S-isoprenylcysteine methyltransferase [Betaproteobacteria bacterium]|nr:protein-S-isoprenylcysteine methyltransferase [Betaproteobacteria bacterium]